jgi:hypothetical protein
MVIKQVTQCPVCDSSLKVTELTCSACQTRLQGSFPPAPLARLSHEHQRFIETFVRCRGIIRDVERALGISYPTVRARLDAAVSALESETSGGEADDSLGRRNETQANDQRRRALLRQVEMGELDAEDAAKALNELNKK